MEFALILSGSDQDGPIYSVLTSSEDNTIQFEMVKLEVSYGTWKFSSTPTGRQITKIRLVTEDHDNPIRSESLSNNQVYYLASRINDQTVFLSVEQDQLIWLPKVSLTTVYLYVPVGSVLMTNDVRLRNWLNVSSTSLISLISLDLKLTSLSLSPLNSSDIPDPNVQLPIIGSCQTDCIGKKCNEDNGCGKICGCPPGFTCDETGNCQKQSPCQDNSLCGNHNGLCPGTCPVGKSCLKDINGYFKCIYQTAGYQAIAILIGLFLIIFLLVLIYLTR